MKRNSDFKRDLLIFSLAGVLLTVAASFWLGGQAVFVFLTACVFLILFVFVMHRRNRRIGKLADEVTHFLHGFTEISFASAEEGELSILEAEIGKMVQKLRTQTELLQKDKSFLADSIADISHQIRTPPDFLEPDSNTSWDSRPAKGKNQGAFAGNGNAPHPCGLAGGDIT